MKEGEVCKTLPEHLVERIIALVPFPSIFKARCLSKCWRARFSSIATLDDEAKKRVAISFQKLVDENSRKWKTFCPVLISSKGELVAYDMETHNWQKMPSISFLPETVFRSEYLQIEGAFLYAFGTDSSFTSTIYVANILTQAWKPLRLPPTPTEHVFRYSKLVVIDRSSETYKLILLCEQLKYCSIYSAQIYDSKSESWSSKKFIDIGYMQDGFQLNSVNLNGVLYLASYSSPPNLWAFNIDEGTFEERNLSSTDGWNQFMWSEYQVETSYYYLVVCNTDLFMVTGNRNKLRKVLKIDVDSLRMVELSNVSSVPAALIAHPRHPNARSNATAPVSDDCHIFFGYMGNQGRQFLRAYNVKDHLWSCPIAAPTTSVDCKYSCIVSFQPSLSPFIAV